MNYGRLGTVIAHEIFHSFDNSGIKYNADGDRISWWNPKSFVEFANRAQCLVDQYGAQIDSKTRERVNGEATLGENIADNGGVRAAYRTFIRSLDNEKDAKVPGYEKYTPEQAFFISYGSVS